MLLFASLASLAALAAAPSADRNAFDGGHGTQQRCAIHSSAPQGKGLAVPIMRCSERQAEQRISMRDEQDNKAPMEKAQRNG